MIVEVDDSWYCIVWNDHAGEQISGKITTEKEAKDKVKHLRGQGLDAKLFINWEMSMEISV